MPRVPTLDQFQATPAITQPVQVGQASVANVPNYGPQQTMDMSRSLMAAGGELSKIVMQQQTDINDAATKEADNIAAQNVSKLMMDPNGGYMTLKGKDAVDARENARKAIQEALNTSGEGLQNDMQRRMYRDVAQRRMQMALTQIDTHASEQTRVWNETETTARIGNASDGVVGNWYAWNQPAGPNNPYTTNKDTMVAETKALAKLKGFGEDSEVAKAAVTAQLTKMHTEVISSMVQAEKVPDAAEYFKRNYNDIDPSTRPKLEGELRKAESAVVASSSADQIWTENGPKRYGEPTDLFKMEAKARELFPTDPMKAKATIEELRSRSAAFDKSEAEFTTAGVNAVGQALLKGTNIKKIQLMPEFLALPGAKQNEIVNAVTDRNHMLWARSIEDRQRIEAEQARKNAPYLFELSDPRRLQNMTREEVAATWTKVGQGNTASLLAKWDSLQNKVENSSIISTDSLIKGSAEKVGVLPLTGKPSDEQKLDYINYERTIADRVNAFEAADLQGRRKASPDEIRKIVQQVEMDVVYKHNSFMPDKKKPVTVITPEDMKNAYVVVSETNAKTNQVESIEVKVAAVPTDVRASIINKLNKRKMPVTEQTIVQAWVSVGRPKSVQDIKQAE